MRPIDGDRLMMHLTDWWYSSFGQAETDESKAIKTVMDKIEQTLGEFALEKQERETQEKPFPFVVGQPAEMFFDGKWEKGKIVAGYRFNDGVVTIETEDGRRLWCGQDRTDIYRPYQEDEA